MPTVGTVYTDGAVRIIARATLVQFGDRLRGHRDHAAVVGALSAWYYEVRKSVWKSPADVRAGFATASFIGSGRVVFNIKGNSYRLIVDIDYSRRIVFIKWLGSHKDYDRIDARTVQYGN